MSDTTPSPEDILFEKTIGALIFDGTLPSAPDPLRVVWDAARKLPPMATEPTPVPPPAHRFHKLLLAPDGSIGVNVVQRDIALFGLAESGHCFSASNWSGVQEALKNGYAVAKVRGSMVYMLFTSPVDFELRLYACSALDWNESEGGKRCIRPVGESAWQEVPENCHPKPDDRIWFVIR